jgi:hypothetical protein
MSDFQASPDAGGAPPTEAIDPAAAQPNAATTDPATGAGDGGEEGQVPQKTFTQQELDEIVKKRVAKAEDRAERRVLRTLEKLTPQQQAAQAPAQPRAPEGKPTRAQFATDDAYVDALTDWKLDQRDLKQREQQYQAHNQQFEQQVKGKVQTAFAKAEKLAGFDADAFAELPVSDAMTGAIIDSDTPEKLMLYLQQNPAEAERIAQLPPARQAAEIGKLEVKALAAKPPARSNAPAALSPARGAGGGGGMPDPSDTKAYIRWANEAERAGR